MPPKSKSKPQKQQQQQQNKTNPSKNQPQLTPPWPPLRPLLPSTSLSITPEIPNQIYLIRNFFLPALCKNYIHFLSSLPLITTPSKPKRGEAVRVNDRFQVEDGRFARMLWEVGGLQDVVGRYLEEEDERNIDGDNKETGVDRVNREDKDEGGNGNEEQIRRKRKRNARVLFGGEPLGLNPNIRVYRYSKGQFFAKHYDDSNTLLFPTESNETVPARTTWTLLIYLSSCGGGETVFYPEPTRENRNPAPVAFAPETGLALLHRHGERCLLHEGMVVTGGEKWVLRSDLVVARS